MTALLPSVIFHSSHTTLRLALGCVCTMLTRGHVTLQYVCVPRHAATPPSTLNHPTTLNCAGNCCVFARRTYMELLVS